MTELVTPLLIEGQFAINVIQNSDNELLLLKRARDAEIGPSLWGFSSGHLEPGETPDQCSLREINEELGCDCRLELLEKFGPVMDRFYGGKYQLFLFHFRWCGGAITLNHEHTDFSWVPKEEFRDYDVVDGIDEDIFYLGIWSDEFLNQAKLPDYNG
jgi:8-oxo-dGTP diphosphatase